MMRNELIAFFAFLACDRFFDGFQEINGTVTLG